MHFHEQTKTHIFFNFCLVFVLLCTNLSLTHSSCDNRYKKNHNTLAPKSIAYHINTTDLLKAYVKAKGGKVINVLSKQSSTSAEYLVDSTNNKKRKIHQFFFKKEIKQFKHLGSELSIKDFIVTLNHMNSINGVIMTSSMFVFKADNKKTGMYQLIIKDKKNGKLKNLFNLHQNQLQILLNNKRLVIKASEDTLSKRKNVEYILSINNLGMLSLDVKIKITNGDILNINGNNMEVVNLNTGNEASIVAVTDKFGNKRLKNIDRYILEQAVSKEEELHTLYHTTSIHSFSSMLENGFSIVSSRIGTSLMDKYIYENSSTSKIEQKQNRLNRIITELDYIIVNKFPFLGYFQLWGSSNHPLQQNSAQSYLDSSRGLKQPKKIILVFNEQEKDTNKAVGGKRLLQPDALKVDRSSKSLENLSRIIIDNSNNSYSEQEIKDLKESFQTALNSKKQDNDLNQINNVDITVLNKKINAQTNLIRSMQTVLTMITKMGLIAGIFFGTYLYSLSLVSNFWGTQYYSYVSFFESYYFLGFSLAALTAYIIELKDILTVTQIISVIKKNSQKITSLKTISQTNSPSGKTAIDYYGNTIVSNDFKLNLNKITTSINSTITKISFFNKAA